MFYYINIIIYLLYFHINLRQYNICQNYIKAYIIITSDLRILNFISPTADSWPKALDDHNARKDWNYSHTVDIDSLVEIMFDHLEKVYSVNSKQSQIRLSN